MFGNLLKFLGLMQVYNWVYGQTYEQKMRQHQPLGTGKGPVYEARFATMLSSNIERNVARDMVPGYMTNLGIATGRVFEATGFMTGAVGLGALHYLPALATGIPAIAAGAAAMAFGHSAIQSSRAARDLRFMKENSDTLIARGIGKFDNQNGFGKDGFPPYYSMKPVNLYDRLGIKPDAPADWKDYALHNPSDTLTRIEQFQTPSYQKPHTVPGWQTQFAMGGGALLILGSATVCLGAIAHHHATPQLIEGGVGLLSGLSTARSGLVAHKLRRLCESIVRDINQGSQVFFNQR